MSLIDFYIKYNVAKIAFVKKHKKVFYAVCILFIVFALALISFAAFTFYQLRAEQTQSEYQAKIDSESGQEQMDYKEMVSESGSEYSISMSIPKLKETDQASLLASEEMKSYFLKQAESYKAKFRSDGIKEVASTVMREQNFYSVETFVFVGKRFISFLAEEIVSNQYQTYLQKYITYFSYDRKLKKLVTLSDIFVTNDAFYKKVSDLVYEAILPELDTIMFYNFGRHLNDEDKEKIRTALSNQQDSFDLFAISDNEILFSFNPFTFATGAPFSETVSVYVPMSELKEFKK